MSDAMTPSERIAEKFFDGTRQMTPASLTEFLTSVGVDDAFAYAKDDHDTLYEGHSCDKDDYWTCQIIRKLEAVCKA